MSVGEGRECMIYLERACHGWVGFGDRRVIANIDIVC